MQKGMTLIELLLVIMIMIILMSFAIPAFMGIGRGVGLRSAVQGVRSTLSLSRQWAITHREKTSFLYGRDETGSFYEVVNLPDRSVQQRIYLSYDVAFLGDAYIPITFKSDGGLTNEEDISLTFTNAAGRSAAITVDFMTGGIRVQ